MKYMQTSEQICEVAGWFCPVDAEGDDWDVVADSQRDFSLHVLGSEGVRGHYDHQHPARLDGFNNRLTVSLPRHAVPRSEPRGHVVLLEPVSDMDGDRCVL